MSKELCKFSRENYNLIGPIMLQKFHLWFFSLQFPLKILIKLQFTPAAHNRPQKSSIYRSTDNLLIGSENPLNMCFISRNGFPEDTHLKGFCFHPFALVRRATRVLQSTCHLLLSKEAASLYTRESMKETFRILCFLWANHHLHHFNIMKMFL